MKATVVVTCYNHEQYIAACLESILSQQIDFECEIVVADDCSSDRTVAIIQDYQRRYPDQISLITREKNLGHARHYIETHQAVSGDIIFEFDGDDIMLPGKLKKQFDLFQNDDSLNLVFHRAEYFSDDGSYSSMTGLNASSVMYFDHRDLALWGTIAVHGSYAYRRSSRKITDLQTNCMEWFYAMDSLLPKGRGAYLDEVLMRYRCNFHGHGSYLSTRQGRIKAYTIYLQDVVHYFHDEKALRPELYSNCLITTLAMLKARCGHVAGMPWFLIKNCRYFRLMKLIRAAQMRLAVAPAQRVR